MSVAVFYNQPKCHHPSKYKNSVCGLQSEYFQKLMYFQQVYWLSTFSICTHDSENTAIIASPQIVSFHSSQKLIIFFTIEFSILLLIIIVFVSMSRPWLTQIYCGHSASSYLPLQLFFLVLWPTLITFPFFPP